MHTTESYLRAGKDIRWWTIGLSVIATQASAITFLSVPGQAYQDGLGFVQFYFGLPIAMVLLSAASPCQSTTGSTSTPRTSTSSSASTGARGSSPHLLFLVSRGLASGLAIYAPALVLSAVLGWPVLWTNWPSVPYESSTRSPEEAARSAAPRARRWRSSSWAC